MTGECYDINSFFIDRLLKRPEPRIHIFVQIADETSRYSAMPALSDSSAKEEP